MAHGEVGGKKKQIADTVAIARIEKILSGFGFREQSAILSYLIQKMDARAATRIMSPVNDPEAALHVR